MYQVETSENLEGIYPGGLINRGKKKGLIHYTWPFKFYGARQVVGEIWKGVFLLRILSCGTHYGIGVFCLTEAGEQQINWVPEKDWA